MKQRRIDRLHGRIMSVETKVRGDALAADALAGATTLIVGDAADFDEDGGWLVVNGQVVEYTAVDDDEGIITLAEGLADEGDEGDSVHVWSTLYDEVVDYQEALVELDGEYDNPEPVVAEVAEGVDDLPEGDRGVAGESCTLLRVSDDEWEVVGVGGRPRTAAQAVKFHQDSFTVATAGGQTFRLSHVPIDNSEHMYWHPAGGAGIYQPGSEWSRVGRTITVPDAGGLLVTDDVVIVEYAYRTSIGGTYDLVPYGSTGWRYLLTSESDAVDRSGVGFDDSGWPEAAAAFANGYADPEYPERGWPQAATTVPKDTGLWLRRTVTIPSGITSVQFGGRADGSVKFYWDGTLMAVSDESVPSEFRPESFSTGIEPGDHVLAARFVDDVTDPTRDYFYADVRVTVTRG